MSDIATHAQAILDAHSGEDGLHCCVCCGMSFPCDDHVHAEAVLVAARDHNTEIKQRLEQIVELTTLAAGSFPTSTEAAAHRVAVAALRLLRGGGDPEA